MLQSITEIAKQLKLDASTVRRYVRAHDIKPSQLIKKHLNTRTHYQNHIALVIRLYDSDLLISILQCVRKRRAA